ncbi:glycosyltransferase [Azoarcus sp. DD4]|uniref:glycosyltransferase family protein n=1 Tax=Azoarcus sp. DD4 TaxID=2027405 RepID=UPI00112D73CC|nr:glycosyltransferase [Azoarcus sp. DD4]QDF98954.1 glycosyltransferase [Azoarcus sp. DD4]
MKILFLVQKDQRVILDRLYEAVAAHTDCDLRWLTDEDQADLRRYFREQVDTARYERIVFFLRFKKEIRQVAFIRGVPKLVILEHDAWQNYFPCKYRGKFSAHYHRLPAARVLCSGYQVTQKLRAEGTDAVFVPKGYDQTLLRNLGSARDIELGFVGSTKSGIYRERKAMLDEIGRREPLMTVRTESGADYCAMLNRIRFFVSADVGMGEYMIKNFEAMACGCVLFAYDQGEAENRALGFEDMKNLVLYRSVDELQAKLARLRAEPALAESIAAAGQALVEREYSFERIGQRIAAALHPALRPAQPPGLWESLRLALRF